MRPREITIIGGGWSARKVDLTRARGYVIGVNDAAVLAPRVDACVSMDRLWVEYRWSKVRDTKQELWLRRAALKNIDAKQQACVGERLHIFECDHTTCQPSGMPDVLNGNNSGACALNLALNMWPTHIWLVGFDMAQGPQGQPYWYPPYPWAKSGATKPGKYRDWNQALAPLVQMLGASRISVYNVSDESKLEHFKRMSSHQFNCLERFSELTD